MADPKYINEDGVNIDPYAPYKKDVKVPDKKEDPKEKKPEVKVVKPEPKFDPKPFVKEDKK